MLSPPIFNALSFCQKIAVIFLPASGEGCSKMSQQCALPIHVTVHTHTYYLNVCGVVLSWIVSWCATSPHMAHNLCHLSVAHPFPLRHNSFLPPPTAWSSLWQTTSTANSNNSYQSTHPPPPIASHIIPSLFFSIFTRALIEMFCEQTHQQRTEKRIRRHSVLAIGMRTRNIGEGVRDGRLRTCSSRQQSARNKAARKRPAPDCAEYYNRISEEEEGEGWNSVGWLLAQRAHCRAYLFVCI